MATAVSFGFAGTASSQVLSESEAFTGPGSVFIGYLTPNVVVDAGTTVTLTNLDAAVHTLTSKTFVSGSRLFDSESVDISRTKEVLRSGTLAPGSYEFFCTTHPETMNGTLTVQ